MEPADHDCGAHASHRVFKPAEQRVSNGLDRYPAEVNHLPLDPVEFPFDNHCRGEQVRFPVELRGRDDVDELDREQVLELFQVLVELGPFADQLAQFPHRRTFQALLSASQRSTL